MDVKEYKKTMDNISAADSFLEKTNLLLEKELNKERTKKVEVIKMKNMTKVLGAVALFAVALMAIVPNMKSNKVTKVDVDGDLGEPTISRPIMGKVAVNIEGKITEVKEDGNKIKVGDKWVIITEETKMGINGPTAAHKEDQMFQDAFEIGNSISGFTTDDISKDEVTAYAIYSNFNWDTIKFVSGTIKDAKDEMDGKTLTVEADGEEYIVTMGGTTIEMIGDYDYFKEGAKVEINTEVLYDNHLSATRIKQMEGDIESVTNLVTEVRNIENGKDGITVELSTSYHVDTTATISLVGTDIIGGSIEDIKEGTRLEITGDITKTGDKQHIKASVVIIGSTRDLNAPMI
ncbi:MAG: hypothetical protein N4A47_06895 [Clostridia bacterium]|jgi:hypothetical protein|nr:hypothetical protein [Clostridia bacterium]